MTPGEHPSIDSSITNRASKKATTKLDRGGSLRQRGGNLLLGGQSDAGS